MTPDAALSGADAFDDAAISAALVWVGATAAVSYCRYSVVVHRNEKWHPEEHPIRMSS
jgi:hypothetical protein